MTTSFNAIAIDGNTVFQPIPFNRPEGWISIPVPRPLRLTLPNSIGDSGQLRQFLSNVANYRSTSGSDREHYRTAISQQLERNAQTIDSQLSSLCTLLTGLISNMRNQHPLHDLTWEMLRDSFSISGNGLTSSCTPNGELFRFDMEVKINPSRFLSSRVTDRYTSYEREYRAAVQAINERNQPLHYGTFSFILNPRMDVTHVAFMGLGSRTDHFWLKYSPLADLKLSLGFNTNHIIHPHCNTHITSSSADQWNYPTNPYPLAGWCFGDTLPRVYTDTYTRTDLTELPLSIQSYLNTYNPSSPFQHTGDALYYFLLAAVSVQSNNPRAATEDWWSSTYFRCLSFFLFGEHITDIPTVLGRLPAPARAFFVEGRFPALTRFREASAPVVVGVPGSSPAAPGTPPQPGVPASPQAAPSGAPAPQRPSVSLTFTTGIPGLSLTFTPVNSNPTPTDTTLIGYSDPPDNDDHDEDDDEDSDTPDEVPPREARTVPIAPDPHIWDAFEDAPAPNPQTPPPPSNLLQRLEIIVEQLGAETGFVRSPAPTPTTTSVERNIP